LKKTFGTLFPSKSRPPVAAHNNGSEPPFLQSAGPYPDLQKAVEFYDRRQQGILKDSSRTPSEVIKKDDADFHQWVSRYGQYPWLLRQPGPTHGPPVLRELCDGQYPWLLRQLGLLVDLAVEWKQEFAGSGYLWIRAAGAPAFEQPVVKTHYQATSPGLFEAVLRDPAKLPQGRLPMDGDDYEVLQVDLDGGALKAARFGVHLQDVPDEHRLSAPYLRTASLKIVHSARLTDVKAKLDRAQALHQSAATGAVPRDAEDLIRGYRVEVNDRGHWRSLCDRHVTYKVAGLEHSEEDVGWVSLALSSQAGGQYLHDTVMTWGGWSAVAPKPGKLLNDANIPTDPPDFFGPNLSIKVHTKSGTAADAALRPNVSHSRARRRPGGESSQPGGAGARRFHRCHQGTAGQIPPLRTSRLADCAASLRHSSIARANRGPCRDSIRRRRRGLEHKRTSHRRSENLGAAGRSSRDVGFPRQHQQGCLEENRIAPWKRGAAGSGIRFAVR
jgi:hypothetical protein